MSQIKSGVFIAAAIICLAVSGCYAAGIEASAAGVMRAENAQTREYTSYELCCMAQYYYKRTEESGYCPPECIFSEEEDGTYTIGLREKVSDGNGYYHFVTYAWYNVDVHGKGKETIFNKEVDFTVYSTVYSPEELCRLAQDYYYRTNDFYPPNAEYIANEDGTYTIHLFEIIDDGTGITHRATCGWLTVNVCGLGKDDLMMQDVDINP